MMWREREVQHETSPPTISASGRRRGRAAGGVAHRSGASLSHAPRAPDRANRACRRGRHHRPPDGTMAVGAPRPAICYRQPAGWRRQYRHRGGYTCACRRLHAAHGRGEQRDQRDVLRKAQLRFHPRHRAGRGHHSQRPRHGGASVGSGQDGPGIRRLRQGQSSQTQHGVAGHRELTPSVRGAIYDDDRHEHDPRALSWWRACTHRFARWADAGLLPRHCLIDWVYQGRQAPRLGGNDGDTLADDAGHSSSKRNLAGLRGKYMVRRWRAQEHVHRDRRQAQQGGQRGARRSQDEGAPCQPWWHCACGFARRLWQADRRGNREVGQGDQVRRHQAAVKLPEARYSIMLRSAKCPVLTPRADVVLAPRTSLTRVSQELLKQPAQFERRALAAVRHHGRYNVARAIDLPVANRRAVQSWTTLRAALTALSPRAGDPALALARQQLPARTRARTRRILASDETAAVESNDVETTIAYALVERAAHGDAVAVAAGGGEADPVGMRRRLPGVALRLIRPAIIGDDVARVEDRLG